MKQAVGEWAADPFMKENNHQTDFDSLSGQVIGVVMTVTGDEVSGFHFSQVIAKLGF